MCTIARARNASKHAAMRSQRTTRGMPPPSVRLWSRIPLPFPPRAPPPCPGGQSAIDSAILPMHHPTCLGHPENPRWHRGQRAIRLPAMPLARCGALRGPLRPTRDITPPAPCNQDIQQRMQYLPKGRMRHPTTALERCQGKDILEQAPLSITHALKSSCHTALLHSDRTV